MTIKERKERERKEMQELILNAAAEIFKEEGIDKVSVRKIAGRIDYSPAIIYHYFKDKDEIIFHLMRRGYGKILEGLASVPKYEGDAEQRLKAMTRKVIDMALEMPDEYCAVQLSTAPEVKAHTATLFKGATHEKQALNVLFNSLKEIYHDRDIDEDTIELTAQIVWTSIFGLIIKLIIEKELPEEQRNRLIEHHIRCIIDAMLLGKALDKK